jgi:hypothetical protein
LPESGSITPLPGMVTAGSRFSKNTLAVKAFLFCCGKYLLRPRLQNAEIALQALGCVNFYNAAINSVGILSRVCYTYQAVQFLAYHNRVRELDGYVLVIILHGFYIQYLKLAEGRYAKLLGAFFIYIQFIPIPVNGKRIGICCTGYFGDGKLVRFTGLCCQLTFTGVV